MAAEGTPTVASSSSGQALQSEATNTVEDLRLKDIDDALASDEPQDALETLPAIKDPQGEYSSEPAPQYDGQNAPRALVTDAAHAIQTWTSIDQEYKDKFQVLELLEKKDLGYIVNNFDDPPEDSSMNDNNDSDEDDQVDEKSSDQDITFLHTKAATDEVERATPSKKRLQQDFSATPNEISVSKPFHIDHTSLDSDSQIAQHPNIMGTELVIQTGDGGDGVNIVTVHDEAKEDEVNGGIVLDKMVEGGSNRPSISTFGAVNDTPAPATGDTSPTTANDVRLAVPSLEPPLKRAKVNDEGILVNVEHTSSSSSAARPLRPSDSELDRLATGDSLLRRSK